jgi:hypothetical protein
LTQGCPLLLRDGRRTRGGSSLATGWPVRNGRRGFALFGRCLAEQDEKRVQKKQRNAAADYADGNLDGKWIRDADDVAKEIDQFFHVVTPREHVESDGPV